MHEQDFQVGDLCKTLHGGFLMIFIGFPDRRAKSAKGMGKFYSTYTGHIGWWYFQNMCEL